MKISAKKYALALFESVQEAKDEKTKKQIIKKFASILIEHNAISQCEKIINYFIKLWNKEKGIAEAEIISARKLDKDIIKMLSDYTEELLRVKKVIIKEKVEKKIKAGFVIKAGDIIMDASLKSRIDLFRDKLCN